MDSNPRSPVRETLFSNPVINGTARPVPGLGERETWYQAPATIRCITESRGGVHKVW